MSERVLVAAVHPDDETLACGATLLKHAASGDRIFWLILTSMKPEQGFDPARIEGRAKEIERVHQEYGFAERFELDLPTTALDTVPLGEIVARVSAVLDKVRPTVLYLPFGGDVHSDHRVGFEALWAAAKSFRRPELKRVLAGETVSETEFAPALEGRGFCPNHFVDVGGYLERKLEIMRLYQGELGAHPFPRSEQNLKSLASFRGARAGAELAEAFMLIFQKA